MNQRDFYSARWAENSVLPTLVCGHCSSIISKTRVFKNEGQAKVGVPSRVLAYCTADDCGAVNCCDEALRSLEESVSQQAVAS